MDDRDLRLDGNAVAGLLQEVFGLEVTLAARTCATCHAVAPLGAHHVYVHAPGVVVRCPSCQSVALRVVRTPGRTLLELSGTQALALPVRDP